MDGSENDSGAVAANRLTNDGVLPACSTSHASFAADVA